MARTDFGSRPCAHCGKIIKFICKRDIESRRYCSRSCTGFATCAKHGHPASNLSPEKVADMRRKQAAGHREWYRKHPEALIRPPVSEEVRRNMCVAQQKVNRDGKRKVMRGDQHPCWKGGKERRKVRRKEKYHEDVRHRLGIRLRVRLNHAIKTGKKPGSAVRDLGCSINEFKAYMEAKFKEGMTWQNWGKWHIDHIIPLSSFDLTNREQFLKACHYTNMQPLWAIENMRKWKKMPVAQ